MKRVLITGANGFLGWNLQLYLRERPDVEVRLVTRQDSPAQLAERVRDVDVVFHLAGVNRPQDLNEFQTGNVDLTRHLAGALDEAVSATGRSVAVVYASSIQATSDVPYGASKRKAEDTLFALSAKMSVQVYVMRLPNVFGKWSRPNYNSVVATYCHNVARGLPIKIDNPDTELTLVYVDDVLSAFGRILDGLEPVPAPGEFVPVSPHHFITLGALAAQVQGFLGSRDSLTTDRVGQGLTRALYATYVSYLPLDAVAYTLPQHRDSRGMFVEMLKTSDSGQFSFFTAHPGITRGGHYHHSKTEKFLVVKGRARFRFRHMLSQQSFELDIDSEQTKIVETIPGWTHDITNIGTDEMIVMLWANEVLDAERPDTFRCPV